MDLEERVGKLEKIVAEQGKAIQDLTEIAILRGQEADRLRDDLSREITHNAIHSMPEAGRYVLVSR